MKVIELGQSAKVISGYAFKSTIFQDDGIPVIKISNIGFGNVRFNSTNTQFVDKEWQGKLDKKYHVTNGDILISLTGSHITQPSSVVGRVALYKKSFNSLLNQRAGKVINIDKEVLNPKYLFYLLSSSSVRTNMALMASGAASQANISPKDVESLKLPVPSLKNQKKIAAILSTYDDLIDVNKEHIKLLEDTATELYKEWFVRFRFPNWESTEFEKGIPTDWREVSLGSICKVVMGQSPKSEYYNENGVGLPFHQGVGTYGERFPISRTYCSIAGRTAYENDILFSVRAPVGRLNIANTKMIIGRGLSAFSSLEGYSDYLYYLLHYSFEREDIIGNGAIFNSVTKDELLGFKILYPSESILKRFNNLAKDFNTMIKALYDKNENLSLQKNSLLPRLMSGRLSVADLDIHYPPSMQTSEEAEEK